MKEFFVPIACAICLLLGIIFLIMSGWDACKYGTGVWQAILGSVCLSGGFISMFYIGTWSGKK